MLGFKVRFPARAASMAAMRIVAVGGKYAFVLFAARQMTGIDFGRYGLLAATTAILGTIFGMEAYQIFLREIAQNRLGIRRVYGLFAFVAAVIAGIAALVTFYCFGWSASLMFSGTLLVVLEYVGLETFRMLVVESRPVFASINVSLRSGGWALLLPILALMGVLPKVWSLNLVVEIWIATDVLALIPFFLVARRYAPQRQTFIDFVIEMKRMVRKLVPWVIATASWRILETGGRFVLAIVVSEIVSGRFMLVAMLGSLSYIGYKGVVELTYFAKLSAADGHAYERKFAFETVLIVAFGSIGSIAGALLYNRIAPHGLSHTELLCVGGMTLASALLSLSYIPHYALYRLHQDWPIALSQAIAALTSIVLGAISAWQFGLPGMVAAAALGAATLYLTKLALVRKYSRNPGLAAGTTTQGETQGA